MKIFENSTIKESLKKCLSEGFFPATIKEVYNLREKGEIPKNKAYDTSTIYYRGEIRTATKKELEWIEKIYEENGRILFTNNHNIGLTGHLSLGGRGCFLGIRK